MVPLVLDWTVSNVTCQTSFTNTTDYACKSNTYCVDSSYGVGYICKCKPGFEGNPYHPDGCHDVDECSKSNNCSMPEQCLNFDGTYRCFCPSGYKGDGYINGTGCTLETHQSTKRLLVLTTALGENMKDSCCSVSCFPRITSKDLPRELFADKD
ncbi:wall-associated receptor kinase 3-like [Prosopis cineraria]|uniref:wall-associated receptor kinase 3-like n=1 Tax=Prosopis cineraria TaxID=364024 RepID=UPI00241055BA|nr:wall-associated receptor kinase 3-like [Prosopis cineraria]